MRESSRGKALRMTPAASDEIHAESTAQDDTFGCNEILTRESTAQDDVS